MYNSPFKIAISNKKGDAPPLELSRYKLARKIVCGYLFLLFLVFCSPFILGRWTSLNAEKLTPEAILKILNAYAGILSGLTGLVGFVIGYYFKAQEKCKDETKE